jgi:hypothetical protein
VVANGIFLSVEAGGTYPYHYIQMGVLDTKRLSLYVTRTPHISVRTCCGRIAVFAPFAQHMARS